MPTKTLPPKGYVIGPTGKQLTEYDLPPPNTVRWVIRRKAEVLAAINGGLISQEACDRYGLSVEELLTWHALIEGHGLRGLRVTRIQHYRANPVLADDRSETDQPRTNGVARSEPRPPMVGATDDGLYRQSLNGGAIRKTVSPGESDEASAGSRKAAIQTPSKNPARTKLN